MSNIENGVSPEPEATRKSISIPRQDGIYDLGELGETGVRYLHDERGAIRSVILVNQILRGKKGRKTQDGVRQVDLSRKGTATAQLGKSLYLDIQIEGGKLRSSPLSSRGGRKWYW